MKSIDIYLNINPSYVDSSNAQIQFIYSYHYYFSYFISMEIIIIKQHLKIIIVLHSILWIGLAADIEDPTGFFSVFLSSFYSFSFFSALIGHSLIRVPEESTILITDWIGRQKNLSMSTNLIKNRQCISWLRSNYIHNFALVCSWI